MIRHKVRKTVLLGAVLAVLLVLGAGSAYGHTAEIQIYNGPISSLLAVHSDIATEVFDDEDDTY